MINRLIRDKSQDSHFKLDLRALCWLGGALTTAILPHVSHLPWWLVLLVGFVFHWRWHIAMRGGAVPGRVLLLLLTICAALGVVVQYRALFGRDAGVALLCAMTALKLLESRTRRDAMILIFLGYLLVMANLLYTQNLAVAAYLLVALMVLLAAQIAIHPEHSGMPRPAPLRLAGRMLAQSLPIMLALFILFPRIPGPLWGLPEDAHRGLTGLSEEMSLGTISELIRSDQVAFRVRFQGEVPASDYLYWRGPVLWRYDGRTWQGRDERLQKGVSYTALGEPVDYTVILEPHGERWLFALDLPARVPSAAGITDSFQIERRKPVNEMLRYPMRSYLHYRTGDLSGRQRRLASYLPPRVHPRTRALAAEWRRRYPDDESVVQAAMDMFRQEPFHYTLSPPRLGDNSVDQFLFETRRGFCEHYAGSFVVLMRAAGIPARVVTGYQGGEINEFGDYLIVRQSDAHAWAEVWLEGRGWVRVDPTAAVAPARVEQGIYAAVSNPQTLPFLARRDDPWVRRLALSWDSLNNAWNEWVLAYGPERQREFLSGLGFGPVGWRGMTIAMIVALGCIALAFLGARNWRRHLTADPVSRAYRRFCRKMARGGLVRAPHEGPLDFAERIAAEQPELAKRVRLIVRLYAGVRYGRDRGDDSVRNLRRLIREIRV